MIPAKVREATLRSVEQSWRSVFKPPERLTVAEWVEKHIYLPARFPGSYPGNFLLSRSPYAKAWYEAAGNRDIRTITLCTTTQCGKTMFLSNVSAYAIAQNPGPILFIFPNEDLAASFSEDRLSVIYDSCNEVCKHQHADRHKNKILEKFFDNCTLRLVGSNSESGLISRPVRWLIMDEIDTFMEASDNRRSAIDLALERIKTFHNAKVIQASTPTDIHGNVWRFFQEGTQERFYVPCPHCGHLQQLVFEQLKWGQHKTPEGGWKLDDVENDTWYQCIACEKKICDRHKPDILNSPRAEWRAERPEVKYHRSFQLNALYPLWTPLGKVAVQFLKTKDHYAAYKTFWQNWIAEPWIDPIQQTRNPDEVLAHKSNYQEGHCPEIPKACVITADVQHDKIYYVIRCWCEGETSYLLKHGQATDFQDLYRISKLVFTCPSGQFAVSHGFIDSGDRTKEVYDYCRVSRFIPWKGNPQTNGLYKWGDVDGLKLLNINPDHWKDTLSHKLRMPAGLAGSWYLHTATADDYVKQMTGEIPVETTDSYGHTRRKWKRLGANHYFDCEVAQCAAASVLDLRFSKVNLPINQPSTQPPPKQDYRAPWDKKQQGITRPDGRSYWDIGR